MCIQLHTVIAVEFLHKMLAMKGLTIVLLVTTSQTVDKFFLLVTGPCCWCIEYVGESGENLDSPYPTQALFR